MLVHHSAVPYAEAAAAASNHARSKLEQLIESGRGRAQRVFEAVQSQQPTDRMVRSDVMSFRAPQRADGSMLVGIGDSSEPLSQHALHQVAARVSMPWTYVQYLREQEDWGAALIADNLNQLYERGAKERYLVRSVSGEVRGVLSDRYRRLDSRPLVDAFASACSSVGALPIEGYVTDSKIAIKALLQMIYEPVPNEVMCFGAVLENSDFGAGALSVRLFVVRLWCTNFAITDESIREVHLGARLSDELDWSDRTHELDTRRMASAISDVVHSQLSAKRIDALQATIRAAHADKIDPQQALSRLRKSLTKAEAGQVVTKFNSPDVELLPPGNTTWRMSNAVSWFAGTLQDAGRKLEVMKLAGALLPKAA